MTGRLQAGLVRVVGRGGRTEGTGFIAAKGLVITCAHVVVAAGAGPDGQVQLVRHSDGARWAGSVVEEWWGGEQGDDVAVLRVPEAPAEAALLLGSPDSAHDRVLRTYGFPAAKPVAGLPGECRVVRGTTRENGYPVHVLGSDEVTFGYSGAPVWDEDLGVAVGMVKSIVGVRTVDLGKGEKGRYPVHFDPALRQTRTSFMIPVDTIRRRCPSLGLPDSTPYRGLGVFEDHRFYFGRDTAVQQLTRTLAERGTAVLVGNSGSGKSSLLRAGLRKAIADGDDYDLAARLRCVMVAGADPLAALVQALAEGRPAGEACGETEGHAGFGEGPDGVALRADGGPADPAQGGDPAALPAGWETVRHLAASIGIDPSSMGIAPSPAERGTDVTDAATDAMTDAATDPVTEVVTDAMTDAVSLHHSVARRLRTMTASAAAAAVARAAPTGLLLLVDQFERLFAANDQETVGHFIDILLELPGAEASVVIALRADFYGRALLHREFGEALKAKQVTVLPMSVEELREAIVEPARLQLREVQRELVETLIADVQGRAGALPLLELTLEQLWKRDAHTGVLTLDSYRALGRDDRSAARARSVRRSETAGAGTSLGVAGAVLRAAEDVWLNELTHEERQAARAVFLRLVTAEHIGGVPAVGGAVTARRAWLNEWDPTWRSLITKFVEKRLVVLRNDPASGQPAAEMAHEALLEAWPRLARWVRSYKDFVTWYGKDFAPAFQLWTMHERREEFLLPKSISDVARDRCEKYPDLMAGPAHEFVLASAERIERVQEAAVHARRNADESRSTLWATRAEQHDEPTTGLALALAAGRLEHPSPTALRVLARVAYRPGLRDELRSGHTAPVWAVARRAGVLVSGAADKDVIVWDPATGRAVRTLRGHSGHVRGLALSADGRVAVSGSDDRTVIRWDVTTGRILGRYEGHEDAVLAVAVTPDGQRIVSASADGTAKVWDVASGRTAHLLSGHRDAVAGVAVGAEGVLAATCSSDGTVKVWEVATGELLHTLTGHDGPVWTVAVDEAGRRAASGSADRSVIVWDLGTGRPVRSSRPPMRHAASVWGVVFGPDGRTVVSAAADRTVAVWDAAESRLVRRFEVGRAVNDVVLDDTGELAFCAGDDHSVTAWRAGDGRNVLHLGVHGAPAGALALSGDASLALVGCVNGDLLVWDTAARRPRRLEGHGREEAVAGLALSRDGRAGLALSASGVLSRRYPGPDARGPDDGSRVHPAAVTGMALSGDGRTCVIATADGEAHVGPPFGEPDWRRLRKQGVTCVAVDGTGHTLLAGDADGHLHLWTGPRRHHRKPGQHSGEVRALAVSGDGGTVLSVGGGTLALWKLVSGERIHPLENTGLTVRSVALNHDGSRALLGTGEGETLVLDLATWELHHLGGRGTLLASAAALSADGQHVVTAHGCARLGVWDAGRGDLLRVLPAVGPLRALAVSADGRWALCGSKGGMMTLWDLDGGEATEQWQDHEFNGLTLSADGTCAIGASEVLPLTLWNLRTGEWRLLSGHTEAVRCVALTPDGRVAVSGSVDYRVILWDAAEGEFLRCLEAHNDTVHAVALGADGRLAVSGSQDASIIVWDTATGGVVRRFGHESAVLALALSPDGEVVAGGTGDGTVSLCRPGDGSRSVLVGHTAAVRAVVFSPDGRFAVSGDEEGIVFVWDVGTGQAVRDFEAAASAVTGLACSADESGMVLVSASAVGEIRLWRLHSHEELMAWAHANRRVHRFTCPERSALLIEPACDPLGNPPPEIPPTTPTPLTRAAVGPVVRSATDIRPQEPGLPVGVRTFDAVQIRRVRRWRITGPLTGAQIHITAEGIDLDPQITLYGPDGATLAAGRPVENRRSRIGPVDIGPESVCSLVVEGREDRPAGGYTLLLTSED